MGLLKAYDLVPHWKSVRSIVFGRYFLMLIMLNIACLANGGELELSGVITKRTISPQGHHFYRKLARLWSQVEGTENVQLTVNEQRVPGRGTQVIVLMNSDQVFYTFIQHRADSSIDDKAQQAIGTIINLASQFNRESNPEDIAASGW